MKQIYKNAGIPSARQHRLLAVPDAEVFVANVGFPIIAKPEVGVGATNSYKLCNQDEWKAFLAQEHHVPYVLEEFIDGDIVSYDALVGREGEVLFEASIEWPPSILDIVVERLDLCYRVSRVVPDALRVIGRETLTAFGVRNRFAHLEFFRLRQDKEGLGRRGDFVALEVNMRPAGANTPDMYNYAHDLDIYRLYAEMVCCGKTNAPLRPAPYYCAFASRRDEYNYAPSHEEILARYGDGIVQEGRNPEMSIPQLGNQYYLFRSSEEARVQTFEHDVCHRV